jgi:hypothetical protein
MYALAVAPSSAAPAPSLLRLCWFGSGTEDTFSASAEAILVNESFTRLLVCVRTRGKIGRCATTLDATRA